jgi:hypothetical protein
MSPEHQVIADRLHEEARCWTWRRHLIGDRIRELEDLEDATETALIRYAGVGGVSDAVLHLREPLSDANFMWTENELDCAESVCERVEHALIALRRMARDIGAAA